jgi:hypothetical protein
MKHLLVTLLVLLGCCAITNAQQGGLKIKFHKDRPVQMLAYERLWDPSTSNVSKRKLKKSDRFTNEEVEEIFRRLADDALLPKGIKALRQYGPDAAMGAHYRMYEQSSFSVMGYHYSLVWIPQDENMHMPDDLRPPGTEGSVFYTYSKNLSKDGRDASGGTLARAGTPVNANAASNTVGSTNSISHSSADLSKIAPKFLGCLAFTYSGMSYLDVVPVYGPGFNKEKDAPVIARRYDMATSYHKYQWFPGRSTSSIEKEFGKGMTVRVLQAHTIE